MGGIADRGTEMRRFPGSMACAECKTISAWWRAPKMSSWVARMVVGGMKATFGEMRELARRRCGWPQARRAQVTSAEVRIAVRAVTALGGWLGKSADGRQLCLQHTDRCTVGLYGAQKEMESDGDLQATALTRCCPGERCSPSSMGNGSWHDASLVATKMTAKFPGLRVRATRHQENMGGPAT